MALGFRFPKGTNFSHRPNVYRVDGLLSHRRSDLSAPAFRPVRLNKGFNVVTEERNGINTE